MTTYLPFGTERIHHMFGVMPEDFIKEYAIPLDPKCDYDDKISIYNYFTEHNIVYQNIRMTMTIYDNWINDKKKDLDRIYNSFYLKIQSGQPFVYEDNKYVKSKSTKEVGTQDDNGNTRVNLDAESVKSIAKKMAEMELDSKNHGEIYRDVVRYRDSFKSYLQTISEIGRNLEIKLMAFANDLKFMARQ